MNASAPDNHLPTAVDDNYTAHGRITPPGGSMLENDTDPDGDALHLANCGAVSHGTLTCNYYYNSFAYEPNNGYVGADSFTYQACDPSNACGTATIHLNVVNNPPHAVDDSYTVHGILNLSGPDALRQNDSDPDGDPFSVVSYTQASHGRFVYIYSAGGANYDPD